MYKLSIEADSMKEIFRELSEAFEDMGCVIIKANEEIPESLENLLKLHNIAMFRKGEGFSSELIEEIINEDQEEVLSTILDNKECLERLLQMLDERGIQIKNDEDNI